LADFNFIYIAINTYCLIGAVTILLKYICSSIPYMRMGLYQIWRTNGLYNDYALYQKVKLSSFIRS